MQRSNPAIELARAARLDVERLWVPAGVQLRGHSHECTHVLVVHSGVVRDVDRAARPTLTRGSVRISPPGDEHSVVFEKPAQCTLLLIDDVVLESATPRSRLYARGSTVERLAAELATELANGIDASSPLAIQALAFELLACDELPAAHPPWLKHVRERMHDSPVPPDAAALASDLSLHPVYIARVFRRHFGCGLGDYARMVRAQRACERILASSESLARIACTSGFSDQAHLTRTLKWWLSMTPRELRRHGTGWREVARVQEWAAL